MRILWLCGEYLNSAPTTLAVEGFARIAHVRLRTMRIRQIDYSTAPVATRRAHDEHLSVARITNMKRTLLRSVPAFDALMTWYTLRDATIPLLGERLTTIFAHAISAETDCLICSTFFRRILVDWGENPDQLVLDDREQAVVAFGRRLGHSPFFVPDEIFAPMQDLFSEEEIVTITSFGALMVATNVVNNALDIPLDDYLEPYRREER
jgi:alkylhydroperoxidase family enzyme